MEEKQGNDKISILSIIYRSGSVDKIVLEEGYYDMANKRVEYTIHDHLGSPRVILSNLNGDGTFSTSNMEVLDRYVYYPFGMEVESHPLHGISTTNEEQYGNKERSAAAHGEILDYEARYYEPSIGRFLGVDPLAGEMPEWGSYTYTFNNPLKYTDPTGMRPEDPPDGGDAKNKLEYMVNSLKEVPNGFLYAIGKLKDQLAGESSKDKIGEGYNLTSKDKIGSDPDLPKADDYKPVEDFTKASLYNVALEHLFNGEDFDKKGVEENHTWKIRTNESQDTQWFTPIDTNNYEYEKPFMRVIDEDGNVEVFGD